MDYANQFRNETGIQAEYFYMDELIHAIEEITDIGTKATLTAICEHLGLKQNHPKLCYYLEYLVCAQKVKHNSDAYIEFYTL